MPSIFFKTYLTSRSALYFAESLPLTALAQLITGRKRSEFQDPEKLKNLLQRMDQLLTKDAESFANGDFPWSLLKPSTPLSHAKSFIDVMVDGFWVARRMRHENSKDFSKVSPEEMEGSPDYYKRNFHFQSGGYFSRSSAKRYEHQVDILFSGTTNAMRRQALKTLLDLKNSKFSALELACGQGGTTAQFSEIFPKAQLIATDLSPSYLQEAKENLKDKKSVDFLRMDASNLSFKDESFDVVFSVYLFHEMPEEMRQKTIKEAYRVLKPGGRLLLADSLQMGDHPDSDWALEQFPKSYHEPFYPNYIRSPLKNYFEKSGFKHLEEDHAFLTKWVVGTKPLAPH